MNPSFKKHVHPYVLLASLPLLILGGCASQDTSNPIEDSSAVASEMTIPASTSPEPIAMLKTQASGFHTQAKASATEAPGLFPPAIRPAEQRVGFGFDQTEVAEQYHELLKQHAQYLAENTDMKLKVNGHTDSYGPKEYNRHLSKQRAEAVAKLLVEYGAPEDRIIISGVADEEPLAGAIHQREQRRVELDYQDQLLVSYD